MNTEFASKARCEISLRLPSIHITALTQGKGLLKNSRSPTQLKEYLSSIDPVTYFVAAISIALFSSYIVLEIQRVQFVFDLLKLGYSKLFSWIPTYLSLLFLLLCGLLTFSRIGNIRLGGQKAIPKYNRLHWFSMLLSTGVSTGFIIWSVTEPVSHALSPPDNLISVDRALLLLNMHWGLTHWGGFSFTGLALAYATYNRGLPLKLSSGLEPLLGKFSQGVTGKIIDIFCVIVGAFYIAATLGLSVKFAADGVEYIFGVVLTPASLALLSGGIITLVSISSYLGVRRGLLRLSLLSSICALLFLIAIFLLGPTQWLIGILGSSLGSYILEVFYPQYLGKIMANQPSWSSGWTFFYLLMWASWVPVSGVFIARISKGRTIREFMTGSLIIPIFLSLIWFDIIGGSSIYEALYGSGEVVVLYATNVNASIFAMLGTLPGSLGWQLMALVLLILFYVTNSDSAIVAISILGSSGNTKAQAANRLFTALAIGALGVFITLTGTYDAIISAAVISGSLFILVIAFLIIGFIKSVIEDLRRGHLLART